LARRPNVVCSEFFWEKIRNTPRWGITLRVASIKGLSPEQSLWGAKHASHWPILGQHEPAPRFSVPGK
jgi:hypothetical protein